MKGEKGVLILLPPSSLGCDLGSSCVPIPIATAHVRSPLFQVGSSYLILVMQLPPFALAGPGKVSP